MTVEYKLLDYSEVSEFREYKPLDTDPVDVDVLAGESTICRYCAAPLREIEEVCETIWGYPAALLVCHGCGWWCQYAVGSNRDGFFEWERLPAALRAYSVSDIELPVAALRRELLINSKIL